MLFILAGISLWLPMGTFIFYGTLITMLRLLAVLPVSYWLVFDGTSHKRVASARLENE